MKLDYDYIICGGGISGLLLASKLSNDSHYKNKSILILDPVFGIKKILHGIVYSLQVGKMLFLKTE